MLLSDCNFRYCYFDPAIASSTIFDTKAVVHNCRINKSYKNQHRCLYAAANTLPTRILGTILFSKVVSIIRKMAAALAVISHMYAMTHIVGSCGKN